MCFGHAPRPHPRPRPLHAVDGVFPSESKVLLGLILMRLDGQGKGKGHAVDARMASRIEQD